VRTWCEMVIRNDGSINALGGVFQHDALMSGTGIFKRRRQLRGLTT